MNGHNNFMAKAFSAFMDMDKMVGGDFEKGLAWIRRRRRGGSDGGDLYLREPLLKELIPIPSSTK
jgi:hypothetical protein